MYKLFLVTKYKNCTLSKESMEENEIYASSSDIKQEWQAFHEDTFCWLQIDQPKLVPNPQENYAELCIDHELYFAQ